jgi:hypothetical protein
MTAADLHAADDYATWSGVLDLIGQAMRTYQDRDADPVHAADRMRTLGRMLDHAATELRLAELDRRRLGITMHPADRAAAIRAGRAAAYPYAAAAYRDGAP